MQKVDLAELRRLHEAATKGEWRCFRYSVASASLMVGDIVCQPPDDDCEQSLEKWPHNAAFIAAAHNALPALLDELEAARRLCADWSMLCTEMCEHIGVLEDTIRNFEDKNNGIKVKNS